MNNNESKQDKNEEKNYIPNKINKKFLEDTLNSKIIPSKDDHSQSPNKLKNTNMENNQIQHNLNLMRNHTQSDVSYQGNTIDMVRILNKKEEGRRSRINIRRKQYQKYQNLSAQKYPRFSADRFTYEAQSQKQKDQNFSTMVHTGAVAPQKFPHNLRNTMLLIQNQQENSIIVGIIIFLIFLMFLISQFFLCSLYLNQGQLYQNQEIILIMQNFQNEIISKHMFVQLLTIYLTAELFYTFFVIYLVKKYPLTGNKIVDKETSSYKYITASHNSSSEGIRSIFQSSRFKGFVMGILAIFYMYGTTCTFYTSQLIYLYSYFQFDYYIGYQFTTLLQIVYFGIILPDTFKYLFLERVVQNHQVSFVLKQSINSQCSEEFQSYHPLRKKQIQVSFSLQYWWMRIFAIIILISIFYSLCFDIWLGVAFISKSGLYFFRVKYRIDSFYIQQLVKLIVLIRCIIFFVVTYYNSQKQIVIFMQTLDICASVLAVFIGICISRILARVYLKQELYKYYYNQMHFLVYFMLTSICFQLLLSYQIQQINFIITENILIIIYCLFLGLILWKEGGHRAFIKLNFDQKRDTLIHQMQVY